MVIRSEGAVNEIAVIALPCELFRENWSTLHFHRELLENTDSRQVKVMAAF